MNEWRNWKVKETNQLKEKCRSRVREESGADGSNGDKQRVSRSVGGVKVNRSQEGKT